jgi:hypothetical protein
LDCGGISEGRWGLRRYIADGFAFVNLGYQLSSYVFRDGSVWSIADIKDKRGKGGRGIGREMLTLLKGYNLSQAMRNAPRRHILLEKVLHISTISAYAGAHYRLGAQLAGR